MHFAPSERQLRRDTNIGKAADGGAPDRLAPAKSDGRRQSAAAQIAIQCIRLYQHCISPISGVSCIYTPSCSEYGAQAIATFGVLRGSVALLLRLIRCIPRFYHGGADPLPKRFHIATLLRNLTPTATRQAQAACENRSSRRAAQRP